MPRLPAARIIDRDSGPPALEPLLHPPLDVDLVVATVGARSPRLLGPDWIRIDGGQSVIGVSELVDRHAPLPAMFDIPGAESPRYRNLLTTTESLVLAASAEFPWVNLRDLRDASQLEHARDFVGDQTRLSCTVGEPRVLQRDLDAVAELGDALLLDLRALRQKLPPSYLDSLLLAVLNRTRELQCPVLLVPEIGPAERAPGSAARLGALGRLLAAGARGLVLTRETEVNPRAQDAIDLARDLMAHVRHSTPNGPAARLGDRPSEDSSGWLRS